ncbi:hypothetical protein ACTFIZ_000750 [Dictyostelium cf. discoideum]
MIPSVNSIPPPPVTSNNSGSVGKSSVPPSDNQQVPQMIPVINSPPQMIPTFSHCPSQGSRRVAQGSRRVGTPNPTHQHQHHRLEFQQIISSKVKRRKKNGK